MPEFLQLFTAICAGISAGCVALLLQDMLIRLHEADDDNNGGASNQEIPSRKPPVMFRAMRVFLPMARPLARGRSMATFCESAAARLGMAGYEGVISGTEFVAYRIVFCFVALLIALAGAFSEHAMLLMLFAVLWVVWPGLWLNSAIKQRHLEIMKALPNVIDLLTLSVESGRDLIAALRDILARRRMDALGEELMRTFQEIQLGRKRTEALRALAKRCQQPDLSATLSAIIQAEELGVSISQLLRIQGDMQRNKRFSLAEKQANEAAVKVVIPVVLCILPAVFVILLGPFALQVMQMFK